MEFEPEYHDIRKMFEERGTHANQLEVVGYYNSKPQLRVVEVSTDDEPIEEQMEEPKKVRTAPLISIYPATAAFGVGSIATILSATGVMTWVSGLAILAGCVGFGMLHSIPAKLP